MASRRDAFTWRGCEGWGKTWLREALESFGG